MIPPDIQYTTEFITGMTKGELVFVVFGTIAILVTLIGGISWFIRLMLKPLANVPNQLAEIQGKLKSEADLNRMITIKIQEHELNCPNRKKIKGE